MANNSGKNDKRSFLVRLICLILAITLAGSTIIYVILALLGLA